MRTPAVKAVLAFVWMAAPIQAVERVFDFSTADLNASPPGFRSTVAGEGKPGDWKVIMDEAPAALPVISPKAPSVSKRPVVGQLSRDRTDEHFPMLIYDEEAYGDFILTTHFKIVDGVQEQMAGVAFRIQDEKNYYYIRASALGNSFYFFKIVEGIRSAPIGAKVEIQKGVWHELTVECMGTQIRAQLDGRELLPALSDQSFHSGKFGFWTKSDSVSYFADTRVTYVPKETFAQTLLKEVLKKNPRLLGLKIFARSANHAETRIIASSNPEEIGTPGRSAEQDVIANNRIYHGVDGDTVMVTMPLRDSNGETVAAVKVCMKPFRGQTEKNAIGRALPIVKQLQARVHSVDDLTQ